MNKTGYGIANATPLTPAIRVGDTLYVSGQVPRQPDGTVPDGIETQTRVVLDRIKALIEEAGGSLDDIVKTTVFLTDRENFAAMNQVYTEYFSNLPPARSTVECGLMISILVEIECIAVIPATTASPGLAGA